MFKLFKELWEWGSKERASQVLSWLFHGSPILLRTALLTFLILSLLLATVVGLNISRTNEGIERALSSPIELTRQPSSAIEALLMATILQSPGAFSSSIANGASPQEQARPTEAFKNDIDQIAATFAPEPGANANQNPTKSAKLLLADAPENDDLRLYHRIVSDDAEGFLFVPGATLPTIDASKQDDLLKSQTYPVWIRNDIGLSQEVASLFCKEMTKRYVDNNSDDNSVFEPGSGPSDIRARYVQSYIVFHSGVGRLCETSESSKSDDQRAYYRDKFSPETLLQTRHWFDPTVENGNASFFYSTKPYIDLGGNGVVETFCHYLPVLQQETSKTAYRTDAVICFDFPLKVEIQEAISGQISGFGGVVSQFSCDKTCNADVGPAAKADQAPPMEDRFLQTFYPANEFNDRDQQSIDNAYQNANKKHSMYTFFGDITPLSDANAGIIEFLVPHGKNRVLAIKFDLTSYEERRTLWLSLAAVCMSITFLLATLIVAGYGLKLREQERAFAVVDTVMSDVPASYARLDEDAKFLKVNDCFAKLLGYGAAAEAIVELRKFKYEDFLVDDASKQEFHKSKQERKEGRPYRSYTVQFWTGRTPGKPPKRWLKVHAGDVPTPHSNRSKPGQSFGILLPTNPPADVVPMVPYAASPGGGANPTEQEQTIQESK